MDLKEPESHRHSNSMPLGQLLDKLLEAAMWLGISSKETAGAQGFLLGGESPIVSGMQPSSQPIPGPRETGLVSVVPILNLVNAHYPVLAGVGLFHVLQMNILVTCRAVHCAAEP